MLLKQVSEGPYLYAAEDIFPERFVDLVNGIPWADRPYDRLPIGRSLRRAILYSDTIDREMDTYCRCQLRADIEQQANIKFTQDSEYSFMYWLDEPGFRPIRHTDGDKPSALQIYWTDQPDLGTAFYTDKDSEQTIYTFASRPNTGYLMLNQPEPGRPELWHDMEREVPAGVMRLCLYLGFGPYQRL